MPKPDHRGDSGLCVSRVLRTPSIHPNHCLVTLMLLINMTFNLLEKKERKSLNFFSLPYWSRFIVCTFKLLCNVATNYQVTGRGPAGILNATWWREEEVSLFPSLSLFLSRMRSLWTSSSVWLTPHRKWKAVQWHSFGSFCVLNAWTQTSWSPNRNSRCGEQHSSEEALSHSKSPPPPHTHTHTHSCASILVRTLIGIMHSLALYSNLNHQN